MGEFHNLNATKRPGDERCPLPVVTALNHSSWFHSGCTPAGLWWLCGDRHARKWSPRSWRGTFTLGALAPYVSIHNCTKALMGVLRTPGKLVKRASNPVVEKPVGFNSFVRWFVPSLGVSELEKAIVNISTTLEIIENAAADAMRSSQIELLMLSKAVLQNRMALDLRTAKEGGVCVIINQSCCAYVDRTQKVETDPQAI